MNPVIGTFSRRTFLGGASLATAYAATPHFPRPPLQAEILVDDERDLSMLSLVCDFPTLRANLVTVRTAETAPQVAAWLAKAGHPGVAVRALENAPVFSRLGCEVRLILGRWMGLEPRLAAMLRAKVPLYCDDATLAFRLQTHAGRRPLASRSLVGLDAAIDPLVDFASRQMHAGQMGRLTAFSATIAPQNGVLAMEAAFIAGRFDPSRKTPLKLMETRNAPTSFNLTTTAGSLQIPLFSATERNGGLQYRLRHFDAVARAEEMSRISMDEIVRESAHLQPLL